MGYEIGSGSGGSDYGYGSGYGFGDGSGDSSGDSSGSEEKRLQIELNILSHIPDSDLPLFIGEWVFEESKSLLEKRLKSDSSTITIRKVHEK